MMIPFTLWDLLVFAAWWVLPWASPVLVVGALVLLVVGRWQARPAARIAAGVLLALQVGLLAFAAPMLGEGWKEHEDHLAFAERTHYLARPQVLGGVRFPAGATVHLGEDGRVEFGDTPAPALIMGAPLVGRFSLEGDALVGEPGVSDGVLARPVVLHGLPCGPGPLFLSTSTLRCLAGAEVTLHGHALASGRTVEVYDPPGGGARELHIGALARPERLYGVDWPQGTVVGQLQGSPAQLADAPGRDGEAADFCLPAGMELRIGPALLHGPMSYSVQGGRRLIMQDCYPILEKVDDRTGYLEVAGRRYGEGERATAHAAWSWTEPVGAP